MLYYITQQRHNNNNNNKANKNITQNMKEKMGRKKDA
jgi:hypothetical protein